MKRIIIIRALLVLLLLVGLGEVASGGTLFFGETSLLSGNFLNSKAMSKGSKGSAKDKKKSKKDKKARKEEKERKRIEKLSYQNSGYADPIDLEKKYPEIESVGEIRFYPKDFLTVSGDSCFGSYTYHPSLAEEYSNAINDLAERMQGKATVFNVPIPLGSGIVIPDVHWQALNTIPQGEAMSRLLSLGSDKVVQVEIYDELMKHRKEYVYFRTDHHWTATGAYYAYRHFCERKGWTPNELSSYKSETFPGYKGYYAMVTKDAELVGHPDDVTIYYPKSNGQISVSRSSSDGQGASTDNEIVKGVADYARAFIHGDNAYCDIENLDMDEGESCVIVKDSFGNAFAPFLTDHYKHVYVADFRYTQTTLPQFVEKYGVNDIIFLLNLSTLRNRYMVGQIINLTR